ncbi:MAG: S-adenosylmethionine decarboxylase [Candidatus Norongarragalinales archaeon]
MLVLGFVTAFATGFFSKLTDVQVDEKRFFLKNLKFATGLAYGILFAFAMSLGPAFANLFLGIAIAVLLAGKVNSKAHQFAVAGFLGSLVFLGFPRADALLVSAFVLFALLDEFLNDYFDLYPSKGAVALFAKRRLSLEVFSLALSVFTGEWAYLAAVLSFDAGYWLAERAARKLALRAVGAFGTHLVLDLGDCPSAKLSSRNFVLSFLNEIPRDLGLRAISRPVVKEVKTRYDEGLSGFVMVAESHVSVHTFPKFHSAHIDVFSCKPFDVSAAKGKIERKFSAKRAGFRVIERMGENNG